MLLRMAACVRGNCAGARRSGKTDSIRRILLCTTSLAAFGMVAATTPSQATDWTGAVSTDWFTSGNWTAGVPTTPGPTTNIDAASPNPTVVAAPGAHTSNLIVGNSGAGMLTIQNGGSVSNASSILGFSPSSIGTAVVTGAGSSWNHTVALIVGNSGTGTLTIQNGGSVSNVHEGYLGYMAGSTGTATVTGTGSSWSSGGALLVGLFGTGTLSILNGGSVSNAAGYIGWNSSSTGTVTVTGAGSSWSNANVLSVGTSGTGTLTIQNGGTVSATTVLIAALTGSTGTLNIGAAAGQPAVAPGTLNTPSVAFGAGTGQIVFNHTAPSYVFAPAISGIGSVLVEAGTTLLTAANTYTGPTTIDGGTLTVNGSITSSSLTTVNAGGTLGGTGVVGNTLVNGGTLAPGNPTGLLTVQGNLAFTAPSTYQVDVSTATADRTNVTGTATLGGATVNAVFAPGAYVSKHYTILNATGGVSGAFNPAVVSNFAAIQSTLSYDANNVFLDVALNFAPAGGSLNVNQQNVADALTGFFNRTGSIPVAFGALTPAGLTQASGEIGTGSQQATFSAMNQFLGVMTDPFVAGRGDPLSAGGTPNAFADESMAYAASGKRPAAARDAFAAYTKAPLAPSFEQRWSVWAAGFGGSQQTDGNAGIGSNATTSNLYGTAVGADYRLSRDTLLGFALAGGGTSFSVVNNLGGGRSDLFQAGAFFRHNAGPAYIIGALAYGWQDVVTDRTVTVAGVDRLRAEFNANAYSGRLEGGYRFLTQGIGLTPYAAGQFTTFDLPAYAEQAIVGSNQFALAYNRKSITDTRSELGLRTDKAFGQADGILTLRGRLAWAHDYNPNRIIGATFQSLPGASFVVNGAAMSADSALVTASAEKKWLNGWSAAATFEGEFSDVTRSYAGKGVVRYAW
ncbi:autotransporter domain-containing protein [Bradyrhizobium sp. NAS80.1]|uniref:autotransporter outer membrane beta-barrel domain-containing protein n=1 Tax=Bradyrhizobium sp. NAS80.1 TaxID=1680159 RepID=UPI00143D6A3A|nr:autotransporter domain-containing protein [Bradyrhizobium sp. NAS80.1]